LPNVDWESLLLDCYNEANKLENMDEVIPRKVNDKVKFDIRVCGSIPIIIFRLGCTIDYFMDSQMRFVLSYFPVKIDYVIEQFGTEKEKVNNRKSWYYMWIGIPSE